MTFIPESDLYRRVFSSKPPTAEKFTDWVTEEVLPSPLSRCEVAGIFYAKEVKQ